MNAPAFYTRAEVVACARFPRLSWLDSVRPETLIVGRMPAPLATAGVVGVAGTSAADAIGITPALPPNAPLGFVAGVAAGAFAFAVLETLSVSLSELASPGRGASVLSEAVAEVVTELRSEAVTERTAELSETGAPTIGTAVDSAAPGRGARDDADRVAESPGGGTRAGWSAPP
jgi:hypothetical protein